MSKKGTRGEGIAVRLLSREGEIGRALLPALPPQGYLLELSDGGRYLTLTGILQEGADPKIVVKPLPSNLRQSEGEIALASVPDYLIKAGELIELRAARQKEVEVGLQTLADAED